jgi:hypothetical protein
MQEGLLSQEGGNITIYKLWPFSKEDVFKVKNLTLDFDLKIKTSIFPLFLGKNSLCLEHI